jgi:hypothetical protein
VSFIHRGVGKVSHYGRATKDVKLEVALETAFPATGEGLLVKGFSHAWQGIPEAGIGGNDLERFLEGFGEGGRLDLYRLLSEILKNYAE